MWLPETTLFFASLILNKIMMFPEICVSGGKIPSNIPNAVQPKSFQPAGV